MMRSSLYLRAVGLCLALAGLIAAGAGSAQAEAGSFWLVKGVKVTTLLPELQGELENKHGVALGEIGGVGLHTLCTSITFAVGNHLLAEGGLLGKILFSGCKLLKLKILNGVTEVLPACEPPGGDLTTELTKGLIRLHVLGGGTLHTIILLEPNVGTTFGVANTSEECAFGEKIMYSGKLALKDCQNAFLTDQVTHLLEEFAPLTEIYLLGNKANKSILDGSVNVSLTGEHKGLTWAGHPA